MLGEITLSLNGDVYGTTQLIAGSSVELSKTQYMKNQIAEVLGEPLRTVQSRLHSALKALKKSL